MGDDDLAPGVSFAEVPERFRESVSA